MARRSLEAVPISTSINLHVPIDSSEELSIRGGIPLRVRERGQRNEKETES